MSKSGAQYELQPSPSDTISTLAFSPTSSRLLVGSWDGNLYLYARQDGGDASFTLLQTLDVEAVILSACWGRDENTIFAATLDGEVLMYDLSSQSEAQEAPEPAVLSEHEQGANKVAYDLERDVLLSTSWDRTLHIHSPSDRKHYRVQLAAKPFALSLSASRAVVAMAERKVSVYDLSALAQLLSQTGGTSSSQDVLGMEPWQDRLSNLKFMARAVACNPDGSGFATSSIEGRVSVEYFDEKRDEEKYAFKCHRQVTTMPPSADAQPGDEGEQREIIYPVNALAFHPTFGTFATGGGDGAVAIWDANTKRRVRQYKELGASVSAVGFSPDGKFLGVGISPGFEDGMEHEEVKPELCKVVVRELGETEAKGKVKGAKE